MYKIFLTFMFVVSLNAELVDGIAIVVKGKAITLYEIKKEMQISGVDEKKASDVLIRKKLEEVESDERKISVSSSEVFDDIKKTASRNNMNVSEFYEAVRNSNGISSSELKIKIKEKILSQKLYSAIAYSSVSQPNETEIKEYYELHIDNFSHPKAFLVVIYNAKDKQRLQEKIANPMFYAPDIATNEQTLPYDRISPELAGLLARTPINSFTPIVPDGKGGNTSFYLKEIEANTNSSLDDVRAQIINMIMGETREQVLSDYFARLKHNADIKILRTVNK
ncbi:MAG: peptidylprolyl isomerase [Campylobacterota bacterium]|nr:peptidylprolyl isomerase [Campylobacterota bacterium]